MSDKDEYFENKKKKKYKNVYKKGIHRKHGSK